MSRADVLAILKAAEASLCGRGVTHAALFGSVARGDASANSDIDIFVDLDPDLVRTIYDYVGVRNFIGDMFKGPVDVVDREALNPHVSPSAMADAVYAF